METFYDTGGGPDVWHSADFARYNDNLMGGHYFVPEFQAPARVRPSSAPRERRLSSSSLPRTSSTPRERPCTVWVAFGSSKAPDASQVVRTWKNRVRFDEQSIFSDISDNETKAI